MKRLLTFSLLFLTLVLLLRTPMFAKPASGSDSSATLSITSPGRVIDVFDGTRLIGTTPLTQIAIDTGRHIFRYSVHNVGAWMNVISIETVYVPAGARVERTITALSSRRITSEPSGASVYMGDSLLGVTPAVVPVGATAGMLKFVRDGYSDATVPVPTGDDEIHAVLNARLDGRNPDVSSVLSGANGKSNTSLYLSGGVAVLSGVAAAYWKIKADEMYDGYRLNGDGGALDRMHAMDRASGISLIASQIGLSVFTYLLLTK